MSGKIQIEKMKEWFNDEETDDWEKHASASFFSSRSNKAHVTTSSHLSLTFARLGNRGKRSFLRKLCRVSLACVSEYVFFIWKWYSLLIKSTVKNEKKNKNITKKKKNRLWQHKRGLPAKTTAHWAATQNTRRTRKCIIFACAISTVSPCLGSWTTTPFTAGPQSAPFHSPANTKHTAPPAAQSSPVNKKHVWCRETIRGSLYVGKSFLFKS